MQNKYFDGVHKSVVLCIHSAFYNSSDRMDSQFTICTWRNLPIDFTRFCQYCRRAHTFSVGQHSVKVDAKVSQMIWSFKHSSIKCDCWHWFACCSAVCALSGLRRDLVSWCPLDTLSSCCTASAASWGSFDVLYIVYESIICQCENLAGSILVHICRAFARLWCRHWRGLARAVITVVGLLWADEELSSSSII